MNYMSSQEGKSMNRLFFGDNLQILREKIKKDSVDLIYLDPPFNSKANYNVLFNSPKNGDSSSQIEAFEDTWHWGQQSEGEYSDLYDDGQCKQAFLAN